MATRILYTSYKVSRDARPDWQGREGGLTDEQLDELDEIYDNIMLDELNSLSSNLYWWEDTGEIAYEGEFDGELAGYDPDDEDSYCPVDIEDWWTETADRAYYKTCAKFQANHPEL